VDKLIAEGVAFFVLRQSVTPAGCGGIQLFGTEYGELKRMYVRPAFRGRGYGRLMLDHPREFRPEPAASGCSGSRPASTRPPPSRCTSAPGSAASRPSALHR
jgi:GNAT superfamily N-acetyltransferase